VLPLGPIVNNKTSLPAASYFSFWRIYISKQSLKFKFAKTKKAPYRGPGFVVFVDPEGVEPSSKHSATMPSTYLACYLIVGWRPARGNLQPPYPLVFRPNLKVSFVAIPVILVSRRLATRKNLPRDKWC
jgi:hypothetical protein